jgi:UDP-3-O-[3-hydroxymyristoyl] N-acetylglucosamine deacetylase/3-hydroxyacyl-[acyl-carrier-protein] dehydratase
MTQVAAARTFTIYEDIEELLKLGKIKGGSLDCAVVIKGDKIISKEPLRFKDEFVRHKILDIIGDITAARRAAQGAHHRHAARPCDQRRAHEDPGRAKLAGEAQEGAEEEAAAGATKTPQPGETSLDIKRVLEMLPHRYPFLMIDRVLEFIGDTRARRDQERDDQRAVFPRPLSRRARSCPASCRSRRWRRPPAFCSFATPTPRARRRCFMSADKVKFRRAVRPGDQLVINAKLTKSRGTKIGVAEATCTVGGNVVSSAELMFGFVDIAAATLTMATRIHPTAIVEPGAQLGADVSSGRLPTSARA